MSERELRPWRLPPPQHVAPADEPQLPADAAGPTADEVTDPAADRAVPLEPEVEPQPQPQPEPEVEPQPEPEPEVEPQPQPEPEVEPQPQPEPEPEVEPQPQPEPEVEPQPQPEPEPVVAAPEPERDTNPGLTSAPLAQAPWAGIDGATTTTPAPEGPAEPEPDDSSAAVQGGRFKTVADSAALRLSLLALSLVAVGLLSYAVVDRHNGNHHSAALAEARTQAVAAAEIAAPRLLSYDYQTLRQTVPVTEALLTPAFAKTYDKTIVQGLTSVITQNKAVETATLITDNDVKLAGVRDSSTTAVTVVLFLDLTSKNSTRTATRLDHTPATLSMVKRGGKWLVDDYISNPTNTPASGQDVPTAAPSVSSGSTASSGSSGPSASASPSGAGSAAGASPSSSP